MINGPSRMVMLLAPSNKNISFDLWGFDEVQLTPPNQNLLSGQRPYYFLQFIQGLNPRYTFLRMIYKKTSYYFQYVLRMKRVHLRHLYPSTGHNVFGLW